MPNYAGVTTRYYGPTNYRGSRIRVTWGNDRVTVPYDYAARSAHESAVREAMTRWGRTVEAVDHVAPSESDRGSVYRVTIA